MQKFGFKAMVFFLLAAFLNLQSACVHYKTVYSSPASVSANNKYYLHAGEMVYKLSLIEASSTVFKAKVLEIIDRNELNTCSACTEIHTYVGNAVAQKVLNTLAVGKAFGLRSESFAKTEILEFGSTNSKNIYKGLYTASAKIFVKNQSGEIFQVDKPVISANKLNGVLYRYQGQDADPSQAKSYNSNNITYTLAANASVGEQQVNQNASINLKNFNSVGRVALDAKATYFSSLYLGLGIAGGTVVLAGLAGLLTYVLIFASGKASGDSSGESGKSSGQSGDGSSKSGDGSSKSGDSGDSGSGNSGSGSDKP